MSLSGMIFCPYDYSTVSIEHFQSHPLDSIRVHLCSSAVKLFTKNTLPSLRVFSVSMIQGGKIYSIGGVDHLH
jgi:hypothetical protein